MDKCPVCGSELETQPINYNKNPDGEFLAAMLYNCPQDGVFALRLGAQEALSSYELARIKTISYLRPVDGRLKVIGIDINNNGQPSITCISYATCN